MIQELFGQTLRLCVARAPDRLELFNPLDVGQGLFSGHNMSTEEIRLTAIQSIQIAVGAIYLLTGTMMPFLTDRPILERFVWAAVFGLLPGLCIIAACVRKR
jgi:hypothetical protein